MKLTHTGCVNTKVKKFFEKIFKGYAVLEKVTSPINGQVQVREDLFGKRRLVAGGISQSGDIVEKIWKKTLEVVSNSKLVIRDCLILGLGAGSAAKLVSGIFPGVKIVGMEIDSEMIRLGKKYFGLVEVKNLEIKMGDAVSCSNDLYHDSRKFDLILVDFYLGDQVPKGAETEEFLGKIKKSLADSGVVIFNRLYSGNHREKTDNFVRKLTKFFPEIEAKKVLTNKLFLCLK